ncbi:cytochrome C biogenesis protein [Clostridium sp. AF19-22AC]|jgi:cytochrome c-type biogenesis protein|uniref:cytochrome c biogenesis CcdA family protein n=1 Tax=Clostridia TaxID=186801 RepID=UPI000E4E53F8|nr:MULTISPECIES: cytochrome c biogenesis protein CcdA [Clostridia]RHR25811.1 cytochrome C biogenesis protein [Clostridium sp. AF19-22AC]
MDVQSLYLGTVLTAGLLSFFSPCIVPLLPVYLSLFSSGGPAGGESPARRRLRVIRKSVLFVAGISICFILLGFGAGALGSVIGSKPFMIMMGVIVIILGLHQTGLIHIKWLYSQKKVELKRSLRGDSLGAFLLGLTFSFGWTPCIGPVLGAILGLSATGGQPLYGAFLMAVYSLGFLVPFMALALFSDVLLTKVKKLNKYLRKIKTAGGLVIIMMGILLMTDSLDNILSLFG